MDIQKELPEALMSVLSKLASAAPSFEYLEILGSFGSVSN